MQAGATLIELVVAIVIITSAAGTIVGLLASMSRQSAESMALANSASIANAYLAEILALPLANPDGQAPDRTSSNSVDDYPGCLDNVVRDRYGNAIAALANYRINVTVTPHSLGSISSTNARLVQVEVVSGLGDSTWVSGFKTSRP